MAATAQVFYPPQPAKKLADEAAAEREDEAHFNKCCCCHVSKGLLVIGAFELFFLIAELAAVVATYVLIEVSPADTNGTELSLDGGSDQALIQTTHRGPYGSAYSDYNWVYAQSPLATLCVGVGAAVVGISVVILMMVGVRKLKARLIIPHMVAQVLGILALFAGSALFIYAAVTVSTSNACGQTRQGDACTKILLSFGAFIVVFTIFAGLQIYFLIISIRCYRYIKEKRRHIELTTSPYYLYQQQQRHYQMQLQQHQQEQHRQQLQQQQQKQQQQHQHQQQDQQPNAAAQQQQQAAAAAYMQQQQQPIYATYANPYGMAAYNYGYRYA